MLYTLLELPLMRTAWFHVCTAGLNGQGCATIVPSTTAQV